jgi:hypothetical protein
VSEREKCEKAAGEWLQAGGYENASSVFEELSGVADLIERERAAARAEGYLAGVEAAAAHFDAMFAYDLSPTGVADAIRALAKEPKE